MEIDDKRHNNPVVPYNRTKKFGRRRKDKPTDDCNGCDYENYPIKNQCMLDLVNKTSSPPPVNESINKNCAVPWLADEEKNVNQSNSSDDDIPVQTVLDMKAQVYTKNSCNVVNNLLFIPTKNPDFNTSDLKQAIVGSHTHISYTQSIGKRSTNEKESIFEEFDALKNGNLDAQQKDYSAVEDFADESNGNELCDITTSVKETVVDKLQIINKNNSNNDEEGKDRQSMKPIKVVNGLIRDQDTLIMENTFTLSNIADSDESKIQKHAFDSDDGALMTAVQSFKQSESTSILHLNKGENFDRSDTMHTSLDSNVNKQAFNADTDGGIPFLEKNEVEINDTDKSLESTEIKKILLEKLSLKPGLRFEQTENDKFQNQSGDHRTKCTISVDGLIEHADDTYHSRLSPNNDPQRPVTAPSTLVNELKTVLSPDLGQYSRQNTLNTTISKKNNALLTDILKKSHLYCDTDRNLNLDMNKAMDMLSPTNDLQNLMVLCPESTEMTWAFDGCDVSTVRTRNGWKLNKCVGRAGHAMVVSNNFKLVVIGGCSDDLFDTGCWEFDTLCGCWWERDIILHDSEGIQIFGGRTNDTEHRRMNDDEQMIDYSSLSYHSVNVMLTRDGYFGVMFGGYTGSQTINSVVLVYNIDKAPTVPLLMKMQKTFLSPSTSCQPVARSLHSATAISEYKLFIFGGWCKEDSPTTKSKHERQVYSRHNECETSNGYFLNDAYILDTVRMEWQICDSNKSEQNTRNRIPGPRCAHTAVWLCGRIYIFGGETSIGPTNQLYVFDPERNEWSFEEHKQILNKHKPRGFSSENSLKESLIPIGRSGHCAAKVGCFMFIHGGYNRDVGLLSDTFRLDITTLTWNKVITSLDNSNIDKTFCLNNLNNEYSKSNKNVSSDGTHTNLNNRKGLDDAKNVDSRTGHVCGVIGLRLYIHGGYVQNGLCDKLIALDTTFLKTPNLFLTGDFVDDIHILKMIGDDICVRKNSKSKFDDSSLRNKNDITRNKNVDRELDLPDIANKLSNLRTHSYNESSYATVDRAYASKSNFLNCFDDSHSKIESETSDSEEQDLFMKSTKDTKVKLGMELAMKNLRQQCDDHFQSFPSSPLIATSFPPSNIDENQKMVTNRRPLSHLSMNIRFHCQWYVSKKGGPFVSYKLAKDVDYYQPTIDDTNSVLGVSCRLMIGNDPVGPVTFVQSKELKPNPMMQMTAEMLLKRQQADFPNIRMGTNESNSIVTVRFTRRFISIKAGDDLRYKEKYHVSFAMHIRPDPNTVVLQLKDDVRLTLKARTVQDRDLMTLVARGFWTLNMQLDLD